MCALVSTWLERAGYDVIVASDGLAGLAKVRSDRPDLVIADVSMPRCDGFSLCRMLREDPSTRDMRVILFTRLDEATDIVNGLAAGVDAFVVKGSGPEDLLRQVEHLLPDDALLGRRSASVVERLRGSFEMLGRQAIFKQLFDACFREVPFDVLAVLVDRVGQPPLLLLGSHYELAPERAEALVRKIVEGCEAMRGQASAVQTIESQLVVIDDTAVWGDAGVEAQAPGDRPDARRRPGDRRPRRVLVRGSARARRQHPVLLRHRGGRGTRTARRGHLSASSRARTLSE